MVMSFKRAIIQDPAVAVNSAVIAHIGVYSLGDHAAVSDAELHLVYDKGLFDIAA